MLKRTTFSIILSVISSMAFCQIEEKMEKERVVVGSILINGKEMPGYIKKTGRDYPNDKEFTAPWKFQSSIRFIPKAIFDNNDKIKSKYFDKYGPKNCDAYIYESTFYESVKYAEGTALGVPILPQRMFLEKVLDDDISLYVHFNDPAATASDSESDSYDPEYTPAIEAHLIYQIGDDGPLKQVHKLNIEKELASCPLVLENYSKGNYKAVGSKINTSRFNKILNNTFFRENVRLNAICDYNENCH